MKNGKTYYSVLEIAPDATEDEIKKAYRNLARKFHPDSGGKDASHDTFSSITEAYNVLSDAEERKHYDFRIGITSEKQKKVKTYSEESEKDLLRRIRTQSEPAEEHPDSNAEDKPDDSFFAKFAQSIKRQPKKEPAPKSSKPTMPRDSGFEEIRGERVFRFVIDGLESLTGTTREIALEGVDGPRIIRVKVPAGVLPGQSIRINSPAKGKDKQTTIKVRVDVAPHPLVERDGYDIIVKIPITLGEAINGTTLDAPGLNEPTSITLPPMWPSEKRIRLKGKGLAHQGDSSVRGDLYVQTFIAIPDRASNLLSEAAKAIDSHYSSNPRVAIPKVLNKRSEQD